MSGANEAPEVATDTAPEPAKDASVEAEKNKVALDPHEKREVKQRRAPGARIVHEVVRQQGIEELERPVASLMWSGIAAGLAISLSVLGVAALTVALPPSPARAAIADLGYSLGFVAVIFGRLQLFTESTVTAIIPLATHPTWQSLLRTGRLWGVVLLANLAGTFIFAAYVQSGGLGLPDLAAAAVEVSQVTVGRDPGGVFLSAVPAGFLMATLVWGLPSAEGQKLWLIILLTGMIEFGHFSHVVAGSAEAWLSVVAGKQSAWAAISHFILPALGGNIVGGSVLFAMLAHAQVRQEIAGQGG